MKEMLLSKGRVALVDDEDYEWLNQWKWTFVAGVNCGYAYRLERPRKIFMHRLIMCASPGLEVDHIDHNGCNNQKANLRLCAHIDNMRYRLLNKNNTSGYKGVIYDKSAGKWIAKICVNYITVHIGSFGNITEAAKAYDNAAKEYFGDFALVNFPILKG